jgi:hypothetical protein
MEGLPKVLLVANKTSRGCVEEKIGKIVVV